MAEDPEIITTDRARAGSTPHIVRYVLAISLVLVIAGMFWAYTSSPKGTQEGATTAADPVARGTDAPRATPPPETLPPGNTPR